MTPPRPDQSADSETICLRKRVRAGEATVGAFLTLGSAISAEICASAGYDWVLVDLEHGSGTAADLLGQLQAVARTDATPLVRVEVTARAPVSRALDPGARGIMFPRIANALEAEAAVEYLRFPPKGVRGVALQTRTGRFGQVPLDKLASLNDDILGIVQVETLGCLAEVETIAAIEGVDVLFVGPGDLSYALGVPGRFEDPIYLGALDAVAAAAAHAGCASGILVSDAAEAERQLRRGFRFIGIGSDSSLLMSGALSTVAAFRKAAVRANG